MLLEKEGTSLLFDPGTFCFVEGKVKPRYFQNLSAIFITHNHGDHCDVSALKIILQGNPQAKVYANPATHEMLLKDGVAVELFNQGEKKIGSFSVKAVPAVHEKVLGPLPENTAYFVDGIFLHPGDSFDVSLSGLAPQVLALPTWAPWMTRVDMVEFAKRVKPKMVVPIHDEPLKDFFLKNQNQGYAKAFKEMGIDFKELNLGEALEV